MTIWLSPNLTPTMGNMWVSDEFDISDNFVNHLNYSKYYLAPFFLWQFYFILLIYLDNKKRSVSCFFLKKRSFFESAKTRFLRFKKTQRSLWFKKTQGSLWLKNAVFSVIKKNAAFSVIEKLSVLCDLKNAVFSLWWKRIIFWECKTQHFL
jgi:hypothetical protein